MAVTTKNLLTFRMTVLLSSIGLESKLKKIIKNEACSV
jgi:hypothetical protein